MEAPISRIAALSGLAALASAILISSVSSVTTMSLLTQATIYAIFAVGLGLLLRQSGVASFGHALFFGSVGYIVGILLKLKAVPAEGAILIAILGLTAFAFVLGLLIVRVPGIAFGMLTLAVGQMFYLSALRARGLTGGIDGMNIEWPSTLFGVSTAVILHPTNMFLVSWGVLIFCISGLTFLMGGRFGAVTETIRDNEERARFIGVRTLVPRAALFALSACVTSIAGVLAALNTGFVSPESLHWSVSGVALMMVVIGGSKTLWGPALGAFVYFLVKEILGDYADHWMAIFGIALITVIVFAPAGMAGTLEKLARSRRTGAAAIPAAKPLTPTIAEVAND